MRCYETGLDFKEELKKDEAIRTYLTESEIEELTSQEHYFRYVDTIFNRVFGNN